MPRLRRRSTTEAGKTSVQRGQKSPSSPLPGCIAPQLSQIVETAPSGPNWVHEIKLDGYRMAARIDRGRVKMLTRTGLDWSHRYPGMVTALSKLPVRAAYIDGELCGLDGKGLPSFAQTQAASDGTRGVPLIYFAFDLLHLDGRDTGGLPLGERKALIEPLIAGMSGCQYNDHEAGNGELIRWHACELGFEGIVSKQIDRPYAPGNLARL